MKRLITEKQINYCQRKFDNTQVEIDNNGHISITGEWFSNYGIIYPHMIKAFKNNEINPCTGLSFQVIGMNSAISKTHADYIYNKIGLGYFDHLIKNEVLAI